MGLLSGMDYPIYHKMLSNALNAALLHAVNSRAAISTPEVYEAFSDGIKYGETREGHFPIEALKGKATKKAFHVTIYRMDQTGTYELTCYIL